MAKGGAGPKRTGGPRRPTRDAAAKSPRRASTPLPKQPRESDGAPSLRGPLRLGIFPGASPGIWVDRWRERYPHAPLEVVPGEASDLEDALRTGQLDAALVRLPVTREGLHLIPLYEETTVVAFGSDSSLGAADELTFDDLAGETRFVPLDDVLVHGVLGDAPGPIDLPGLAAPRGARPETTADALAIVSAGAGIVILPLSLVRLHQRRDVAHRPLVGAPASAVALAWVAERTSPEIEALVGIVRGRTARSSRA